MAALLCVHCYMTYVIPKHDNAHLYSIRSRMVRETVKPVVPRPLSPTPDGCRKSCNASTMRSKVTRFTNVSKRKRSPFARATWERL